MSMTPSSASEAHQPVNPVRKSPWLSGMIGVASFVLLSIVLSVYWLFLTSSGLHWLLMQTSQISGDTIRFSGIHGTLRSMHVERIDIEQQAFSGTLLDTRLAWQPQKLFSQQVSIDHITIASIQAKPTTPSATASSMPDSLQWPVAISIPSLHIGSIHYLAPSNDSSYAISQVESSFNSNGLHHQLNRLDFHTPWGQVTARASLDGQAPFRLNAQLEWQDASHWGDAIVKISGDLSQLSIQSHATQTLHKRDLTLLVQPFADNPIKHLQASFEGLNPVDFIQGLPNARLSIDANLLQNDDGTLSGPLRISNSTASSFDEGGIPFTILEADTAITPQQVSLQNMRLQLAKLLVAEGNLTWQLHNLTGQSHIEIKQLNPRSIDKRLKAANLSGSVDLQGDLQRQSAEIHLKDKNLRLQTSLLRTPEQIAMQSFILQHNQSRLTAQASWAPANDQPFELSGKLERFNMAHFLQGPETSLNASFEASGTSAPHISGIFDYQIQKSHWAKSPMHGSGHVTFNTLQQWQGQAQLHIGSNHIHANGDVGRSKDWLELTFDAPTLAQLGLGLTGDAHGRIKLHGKQQPWPDAEIYLHSKRLDLPGQHRFSGFFVKGDLQREALTWHASLDSYRDQEQTRLRQLTIDGTGSSSAHDILIRAQLAETTKLRLHASGGVAGQSASSALRWDGQLTELSVTGNLPVHLQSPVALSVQKQSIMLGPTRLALSDGYLAIEQFQWTPKDWKTRGHFSGVAIHPSYRDASQQSAVHLGGRWNWASQTRLEGHLHIQREQGDWFLPGEIPQPFGLKTLQLKVDAQDNKLTGSVELSSETIGTIQTRATLPLHSTSDGWSISTTTPISGAIQTRITNLKWLDELLGESMNADGSLQIQADVHGTWKQPVFSGTATGQDLSLLHLDHGIDIQQGNLVAHFDDSNLIIDHLRFNSLLPAPTETRWFKDLKLDQDIGKLNISGNIDLMGHDSLLDFQLHRLPLAHKTDYWIIASGSGQARWHSNQLILLGKLRADAGLLLQRPQDRPELSDDIVLVSQSSAPTQSKLGLLLDMQLDLGDSFYIRASGLEGRLAGQLRVQNTARNKLQLNGSITAQDTTFKAYGQDLTVKRGIVSFQGPLDNPELNVLALREGLQVEAGVEIMGSVRHPQVKLVSTPNVPDTEKLSWIVLGRKPDTSGLDVTTLVSAAGSILGGQTGSGITDQITRTLGVDEITFRQAGVGSSLSGQIGVVGKRLSSRAYLSYERSLATTTMGITKLTYNLTPRITVVTQAGEDNAADLFYTVQFD